MAAQEAGSVGFGYSYDYPSSEEGRKARSLTVCGRTRSALEVPELRPPPPMARTSWLPQGKHRHLEATPGTLTIRAN